MSNSPAQLTIGWDLDGVLYPFVDSLRDYIHHTTGRPLDSMPPAATWNFAEQQWALSADEFLEHFRNGVRDGAIFRQGTPCPGGVEAMTALVEAGHRIVIVTDRRLPGVEQTAEENTRAWLAEHDVPHDELVFSRDKTVVRTDVFLDDRDVNYDALAASGLSVPWLLTRPWNQHHPGRRVESFSEFVKVVENHSLAPAS